jgi:hypothetical protein
LDKRRSHRFAPGDSTESLISDLTLTEEESEHLFHNQPPVGVFYEDEEYEKVESVIEQIMNTAKK